MPIETFTALASQWRKGTRPMTDDLSDKQWHLNIDIPEGTSGTHRIVHEHKPPGTVLELASIRTAILAGHGQRGVQFDFPTRWHKLVYEGGTWMTDYPIEQIQIDHHLEAMHGDVLVGGLGLGYAAVKLCERDEIESVTVIELSQDVINLVAPHVAHPKLTVICADLDKWVVDQAKLGERWFDFAFYDTWQSDGEGTFHHTVIPLRTNSEGLVGGVACWNEDIMRGQLRNGLISRFMFVLQPDAAPDWASLDKLSTPRDDVFWDWQVPFFVAAKDKRIPTEFVQELATTYARIYGLSGWEEDWERELLRYERMEKQG